MLRRSCSKQQTGCHGRRIVNPGKICRLAAIEEIAISIVIGQICVIKSTPVARLLIHAFYIGFQQAGDSLAGDSKNRKWKVRVEPTTT
jgi:hypothetical protein